MPRRLYAILPEPGEPIEFAAAEDGSIQFLSGRYASAHPNDEVVVFVPGTEVGCHLVQLPQQKADQLRKSAAYAIEDEIAVPVEDVHVAIGLPLHSGGARPAYVVDPKIMDAWIAQVEALGVPQARLIPDVSVLPATDIVVDTGRHFLFSSAGRRFAADAGLPDDALQALVPPGGAAVRIVGPSIAQRLARSSEAEPGAPLISRLAQWAELAGPLTDLRQGPFSQHKMVGIDLRDWQPLLAGTAATLTLFVAAIALEANSLVRLSNSLDAQARSLYSAANPDAPVPADLTTLVSTQNLLDEAQPLGFLDLSALLYESIIEEGAVVVHGLRYDAATNRLIANLSYPDYGGDIDIKSRLEAKGLKATLGDSRMQDGRVIGDITLESTS